MDYNRLIDTDVFCRMAREFPLRTAIFTFGLPAFALFQLLNGIVHGGSLPVIVAFTAVAVAGSVLLAQYQVAVYRRRQVARDDWPKKRGDRT